MVLFCRYQTLGKAVSSGTECQFSGNSPPTRQWFQDFLHSLDKNFPGARNQLQSRRIVAAKGCILPLGAAETPTVLKLYELLK